MSCISTSERRSLAALELEPTASIDRYVASLSAAYFLLTLAQQGPRHGMRVKELEELALKEVPDYGVHLEQIMPHSRPLCYALEDKHRFTRALDEVPHKRKGASLIGKRHTGPRRLVTTRKGLEYAARVQALAKSPNESSDFYRYLNVVSPVPISQLDLTPVEALGGLLRDLPCPNSDDWLNHYRENMPTRVPSGVNTTKLVPEEMGWDYLKALCGAYVLLHTMSEARSTRFVSAAMKSLDEALILNDVSLDDMPSIHPVVAGLKNYGFLNGRRSETSHIKVTDSGREYAWKVVYGSWGTFENTAFSWLLRGTTPLVDARGMSLITELPLVKEVQAVRNALLDLAKEA